MKVRTKKIKPDRYKIGKVLEEMMYSAAFDCHGEELENQLPIVIDVVSLLLATADGNAFTTPTGEKHFYFSYNMEAIIILKLGIQEYMKKVGMDNSAYSDDFGFKKSLKYCIYQLEKENPKKGE